MIPIKLTIKGLYSYQSQQIISFDQLIESQLFGIFGSVGSGKSSILEAITFAIYGETDRMNAREQRTYNMMNLKSDELWIDLECLNYKNDKLKFTVKGRRNTKNFLDVRTFDRKSYLFDQNDWMPIDTNKSLELIGLSYENFRRTIIIPQGRFKEFLELGNKDRTGMLKELFHLDRFDLQANVSKIDGENNAQLQLISGQLIAFEELSEAQVVQLQNEAKDLQETTTHLANELLRMQEQLHQMQSQFGLQKELSRYTSDLNEMLSQEIKFKNLEIKTSRMDTARNLFQDLLSQINLLEQQIQNQQVLQQKINAEISELKDALLHIEKDRVSVQAEFDNLPQLEQDFTDAKIMVKLTELLSDHQNQLERVAKGTSILMERKQALEVSTLNVTNMKHSLNEAIASLESREHFPQVQLWYSRLETQKDIIINTKQKTEQFQKEHLELQTKLTACQGKIATIKATIKEKLNTLGFDDTSTTSLDWKTWLDNQINKLSLQVELEAISSDLIEGRPCPLCGSIHHPNVHQPESVKREFDRWKSTQSQIEVYSVDLLRTSQQKEFLDQSLLSIYQKIEGSNLELKKQEDNWETLIQEAPDKLFLYNQQDLFLQALQQYQQDKKDLQQKRDTIHQNEDQIKILSDDLDRYQLGLGQIQNKISEIEGKVEAVKENLSRPFDSYDSASNWEAITAHLTITINEISNKYEVVSKKYNTLSQQVILKEKELESNHDTLQNLKQNLYKTLDSFTNILTTSDFNSLKDVQSALYSIDQWTQDKQELQIYNDKLNELKNKVQYIVSQIIMDPIQDEMVLELKEQLDSTKEKHLSLSRSLAQIQSQIDQKQKNLIHKLELEKAKHELLIRKDNISKMNTLFRASGFVNYISSVYLQDLCSAANERFYKLTRQQLKLEIDQENNFIIRDYLNDGKIRSINTLSGGQTFQASLCLALALSDSLSNFSKSSKNFFFLDEGFGSLDKSSLATVFETLKSLRKENRIVGIISHVEEMQQEIDTFISITNDPDKGSFVKNSWSV
jgi:exonuclease SbcC